MLNQWYKTLPAAESALQNPSASQSPVSYQLLNQRSVRSADFVADHALAFNAELVPIVPQEVHSGAHVTRAGG
jgi:hypothetical protein